MTSQPKTCVKCGGQMKGDKRLGVLEIDLQLMRGIGVPDINVQTFCCEKCGYIELYRVGEKPWRSPVLFQARV